MEVVMILENAQKIVQYLPIGLNTVVKNVQNRNIQLMKMDNMFVLLNVKNMLVKIHNIFIMMLNYVLMNVMKLINSWKIILVNHNVKKQIIILKMVL